MAADADGVHVGQADMEAGKIRDLMGRDKIIGVSATTVEQAVLAERSGADYLGVGAVFPTGSKADAANVSYETLKEIPGGELSQIIGSRLVTSPPPLDTTIDALKDAIILNDMKRIRTIIQLKSPEELTSPIPSRPFDTPLTLAVRLGNEDVVKLMKDLGYSKDYKWEADFKHKNGFLPDEVAKALE